jgi:DNA-directed RNA polymerase specialized sigma24 family protein
MNPRDGQELEVVRRQALEMAAGSGLRDRALREDVAQEVTLRAWRNGIVRREARVRSAWVRTTVRRCVIDALRGAGRERCVGDELDGRHAAGEMALSEERIDARREVASMMSRAGSLPRSLRAVYAAVVCEGQAIEEAARALGVTRAVVDTRLRRMRKRLAGADEDGRTNSKEV